MGSKRNHQASGLSVMAKDATNQSFTSGGQYVVYSLRFSFIIIKTRNVQSRKPAFLCNPDKAISEAILLLELQVILKIPRVELGQNTTK